MIKVSYFCLNYYDFVRLRRNVDVYNAILPSYYFLMDDITNYIIIITERYEHYLIIFIKSYDNLYEIYLFNSSISPHFITFLSDMETIQNLSMYAANFEKKSLKVDLSNPTAQSSQWGGKKNPGY